MSGFLIDLGIPPPSSQAASIKLVDFGECEAAGTFQKADVRAGWVHWTPTRQWHITTGPSRVLIIEGQPDRLPDKGERLECWLSGRSGSFRGFEIVVAETGAARVSAFVDPLGSRPVFYRCKPGQVLISDKLATIALNARGAASVNWGALLEAATIGALYSQDTTLNSAAQLSPGELIVFEASGPVRSHRTRPVPDPAILEAVRRNPPAALTDALRRAVCDTWVHRDDWLLLSGGLDSRFSLAVAGERRKTLTVTTRDNFESRTARAIAECCGADFRHWQRPPEQYLRVLRDSILLTGGIWESPVAHHLGMAAQWRRTGIQGIAHAYLYDTYLKGYFLTDYAGRPSPPTSDIAGCRGGKVLWVAKTPHSALLTRALTGRGRELLHTRMSALDECMEEVVEDGWNVTIERLVLSSISRQCHYPILLAWSDEIDVSSPVFHPALQSWHAGSRAADRANGRAFRAALRALDHPVMKVLDANTGRPVGTRAAAKWRALARRLPGFAILRSARRKLLSRPRPPAPASQYMDEASWPPLPPLFRQRDGIEVLEEGISAVADHEFFHSDVIRDMQRSFLEGDDRLLEPLFALMTVGRWIRLVADSAAHASGPVRCLRITPEGSREG